MADVTVDLENASPKELYGQGIRAFVLQDFTTAVQALSRASELLVKEHGDELHESLGDIYLYYGKALLGLSRDEAEALGDAVPKNVEEESDEEEVEEEKEENSEKVEGEGDAKSEEVQSESKEEKKEEEKTSNGSTETNPNPQPSCSNSEEKPEETSQEEDDLSDLQVAWEILELAKKIFTKKGEEGRKNLAETLIVLGEIAMESENFESAINDIKEGLAIQKQIFENDSRAIAETLYKLGMAYSTGSQIDDAVGSFEESLQYLKNRVEKLKSSDDQEAKEEVADIEALIPEVEEKIADMKSYKEEAVKKIASAMAEEDKPTSTSSSSGKANDISHLVKRKRKLDEVAEEKSEEEPQQPTKKVSP